MCCTSSSRAGRSRWASSPRRSPARGLVRRRASAEDRRVKVLDLTPKGSRLRALLLDRMTAPPATIRRLSVQEQRTLVRILARLLE